MQMLIVRGHAFTAQDQSDGTPVAIINETMARRFWPNEDPVGKRFTFDYPRPQARWLTVVGVVRDSKRQGLDKEVRIECFAPHSRWPRLAMEIGVRTTDNPLVIVRTVRETVWSLNRELPVSEVETVQQMLSEQGAPRRFSLLLLSLFAMVALLLAAIGIYGVMTYSATWHTVGADRIGDRFIRGFSADTIDGQPPLRCDRDQSLNLCHYYTPTNIRSFIGVLASCMADDESRSNDSSENPIGMINSPIMAVLMTKS
jgi:hypothetical protein